jgi:hypothetical protein
MDVNIHKMKVAELRKLVSDNSIFRGGLSSMKKRDIVNNILNSDWYKSQNKLPEPTPLERQLADIQPVEQQPEPEVVENVVEKEVIEPEKQEVIEPEIVNEPTVVDDKDREQLENRLEYLQEQLRLKQVEEQELERQISFEQEGERVKLMIQEALDRQKEQLMSRLFS